jgi:5'-nucleotidase
MTEVTNKKNKYEERISILEERIKELEDKFIKRKNGRKIVYIDLDEVIVDFMGAVAKLNEEERERYRDWWDYIPGIFATMEPIPGALEAIRILEKNYPIHCLAKPPKGSTSAWKDKREWMEKHYGKEDAHKLVLSPFKELSLGDYLIDDRPVPGFTGEQISFKSTEFPDWNAVLKYFKTKEGIDY